MRIFKIILLTAIIFPLSIQGDDTLDAELDALLSDEEKIEMATKKPRPVEIKKESNKDEAPIIIIESQPNQTLGPTIKTFFYVVEKEGSFKEILLKRIGFSEEVLLGQGYLKKLLDANAHVSDVRKVPVGTRLYIEHPYEGVR